MKTGTIVTLALITAFIALVVATVLFNKAIDKQEALVAERDATISELNQGLSDRDARIASDEVLLGQKDSIIERTVLLYANAQERNTKLEQQCAELSRQNAKLAQDTLDLASAYVLAVNNYTTLSAANEALVKTHADLQRVNAQRGQLIGEYMTYTSGLQPHLEWLQNEADRNWWEKLWDRDKLPKPPYPLPQPPVITARY